MYEYLFYLHREDIYSLDNEHIITASLDTVDTDMREEPDVTSEQAAGENPDRIDSDTVELFVKDVLGEDGAKEIEEILKEALA